MYVHTLSVCTRPFHKEGLGTELFGSASVSLTTTTTQTYLCFSSYSTIESSEWYNLLLLHDVIEIPDGLSQVHALDSLGSLAGILEMYPQLHSAGLTCWSGQEDHTYTHPIWSSPRFMWLTFRGVFWFSRVPTHGLPDLSENTAVKSTVSVDWKRLCVRSYEIKRDTHPYFHHMDTYEKRKTRAQCARFMYIQCARGQYSVDTLPYFCDS